jgi:hypothetical protein
MLTGVASAVVVGSGSQEKSIKHPAHIALAAEPGEC